MRTVAYMGYSADMIKALEVNDDFELKCIVGKKGRLSEEYYDNVKDSKAIFYEVESKADVLNAISEFDGIDVVFMYKYESVTWIFAQTYPLAMISENA